jgi:hypothetical protein
MEIIRKMSPKIKRKRTIVFFIVYPPSKISIRDLPSGKNKKGHLNVLNPFKKEILFRITRQKQEKLSAYEDFLHPFFSEERFPVSP